MTTGSTGTKRRTLLQRGVALLAGGAALAGTSRWAGAAPPPAPSPPPTRILYARARPSAGGPADGRVVASGDLLDAPDGRRLGTFTANGFGPASPFGPQAAAPNLEFHALQLAEGTLFAVGTGADPVLAVIAGTGRFAGRSGSLVRRLVAADIGDDVSQFTITLTSEGDRDHAR